MSLFSENSIASTVSFPRKRTRQDSDNTHSLSPVNAEEATSSNPTKRAHLYSWELVESTSPLTPESGIDINESPCSGYGANSSTFERGLSVVANNFAQHQTSAASATAMDLESSSRTSDHCDHPFKLRIVDQPEESYRARYDSEGCRGPMKGRTGGCPAVEIDSFGQKWYNGSVQVQLVSSDGSRLQSCVLDSQNEKNVSKRLQYGEKAQFDNLRIRRLKKQDHKSQGKGTAVATGMAGKGLKSTTVRGKQDEKVAYLLFTATIDTDHGTLQLKALSESIYLNANHDPPEIHRLVPNYGSSNGGETIAIIGTRMHSPKVSFVVVSTDGKEHELIAEIDKEVSHQNALVVRVPTLPLPCTTIQTSTTTAYVIVTAGKGDRGGKDPLKSSPYHFTYIARGLCKECYQRIPQTPPLIAFQGQIGSPGKVQTMIPPVLRYPHTSQPAIMTSVITIPQPIPQRVQTCSYTSLPSTSSQPYSPALTRTNTYATSHVPSPIPSAVISSVSPTVASDGGGEQSVMEILNMLGEDNQPSPCSSPSLSCAPSQSPTTNCGPTSAIEPSITEVVSLSSCITDSAPMSPEELVRKYLPPGGIESQAPQSCSSPPACSPNNCDFLQTASTSQSPYLSHCSVTTSQYLAGSDMLPMSVGFPQNQ